MQNRSACRRRGGKINSPPCVFLFFSLGQIVSGPELCGTGQRDLAQSGGLGWVRPRPRLISFWAGFGPILVGPSSAQYLLGRDRPNDCWAGSGPV